MNKPLTRADSKVLFIQRGESLSLLLPMSTLITSDKTAFIKSFIFNAGSTIVSVEFRKLDGTIRSLQFNPRDTQEVKGTGNPTKNPSIVRCRDFTIARTKGESAWRSFDCQRVVSIKANGTTVYC
tara:strand:- start:1071 stop:1445 length:375 start_codon:yes stop_codon:yes gene_type:complete